MKPKKLSDEKLMYLREIVEGHHATHNVRALLSHIDAITAEYNAEINRLNGLLSLQAEGMKQMSQQIASYRELIFKEGKHNVNS